MAMTTSCPVCRTAGNKEGFSVNGHFYARCESCNLLHLDPIPGEAELEDYYQRYRDVKDAEGGGYLTPGHLLTYRHEKELTFRDLGFDLRSLKSKKVLEVGCANGPFLTLAKDMGAEILGIDISADLVQEAVRSGLNCRVARVEQVEGEFDVICLWDVIEHVTTPHDFLGQIRRLSCNGTNLFVQTPRYGRIAELYADSWRYLMPIEHVILYSLESLTNLLGEYGFRRRGWVSFGSGNTAGSVSAAVKRAFDGLAKETGHGDTLALWAVREDER
jgi:2-polyprenyl-3-methyl-5-hydroxy-6-metoxy-1,4-benzoquinol methylase